MSDTAPHAETLTPRSAGESQRWEPPAPAELQAMLSDYMVERLVGRGGMGAVYQARQISLNRPVALKIIADDLDDADGTGDNYTERFKNEARAMARMSNSGIVSVYDFGQTLNGLLYIAMEYVEGTDVARMLEQQKRLLPKHALAITAQVCSALACAHERGIIHRDIKPANILIDPDDVVKVADFGLAKVHSSDGQTLGLTQSGIAMGTLHYMAPESLILGTAVDHRADIYAVGVMLYQMITGKLPHGLFKPPSQHAPGLDPRYDALITKAMRSDRDRRYQTIQELHRDLCDLLTGGTLKAAAAAAAAAAPAPTTLPRQTLQQVLSGLKPRLSAFSAKIRPLMRSLTAGGSVVLLVTLVVVVIAFAGYAAMAVTERIWPHQSAKLPASPKPSVVSAPASPATPPAVLPQPVQQPSPALTSTPATVPIKTVTQPTAATPPNTTAASSTPAVAMTAPVMPKPSAATPAPTATSKPDGNATTKAHAPVLKADPRLAKLEADFDKFWREEMYQPYLAELSDLRKRYVETGLTPARAEAQKRDFQNEVHALDTEIDLVQSGAAIPAASTPGSPASLVKLRRLYHQLLAEYAASRRIMTPPVLRANLKGFDVYINELKKAGKLEEAERAQAVRDSKAELKLK